MLLKLITKDIDTSTSTMTVIRLSEQKGARGKIQLDRKVKILNMLEETETETDVIEYKPFEIITIGI